MTKITLSHLTNLQNEATAVNTLNANSDTIVSSFDNTLSRNGITPNQMMSVLDMNSNQIINLPAPNTTTSPVRLVDITIPITVPSNILSGNNVWIGTNTHSNITNFQNYLEVTGGSTPSFLDLYTAPPLNGVYVSNAGATIGNAPLIGALAGLTQVSTIYVKSTAAQNASLAEYMVTFDNNLNSGKSPPWKALTVYAPGNYVVNESVNNLYVCTVGGTSAASGGPTTTGAGIVDGSVTWNYVNSAFITAKVGFFNSTVTGANSSNQSWGMANDFVIKAGDTGIFKIGAEFDITNNAFDYVVGSGLNAYNLYINGNSGLYPITAQIGISPQTTGGIYSAHYGILINGAHVADAADVEISGSAGIGLSIGGLLSSTHSSSSINDSSTSPVGLNLQGTYSIGAINLKPAVGTCTITQGTNPMLKLIGTASAVNCISIANQPATLSPFIASAGTDTNLDLGLVGKGTGQIVLGSAVKFNAAGSFTANGAVATAMSSIGPTGSHTTVQKWLTINDNTGTTLYIPCF